MASYNGILKMFWLETHNSIINWKVQTIEFDGYATANKSIFCKKFLSLEDKNEVLCCTP